MKKSEHRAEVTAFASYKGARALADASGLKHPDGRARSRVWDETFEEAVGGTSVLTDNFVISDNNGAAFLVEGAPGERYITANKPDDLNVLGNVRGARQGTTIGFLVHRTPGTPVPTLQLLGRKGKPLGLSEDVPEGYDWMFFNMNEYVFGFTWSGGNLQMHGILLVDWTS